MRINTLKKVGRREEELGVCEWFPILYSNIRLKYSLDYLPPSRLGFSGNSWKKKIKFAGIGTRVPHDSNGEF